jgi:ATP-dependent Clp protease, protease subunit
MKNRLTQLVKNNSANSGFFRLAMAKEPTIYLYTYIGKTYDWETGDVVGASDADFVQALAECRNSPVMHLRINSPGGDVFQCKAMQTAMMQHPGIIACHVDGLAASAAASLLPYAGSVEMSAGSFLMIHKSMTYGAGNSDDFTQLAGVLNQVDESIAADFERKTGIKALEIMRMMKDVTYLNAKSAKSQGFCDSICEPAAKVENRWDLSIFGQVPEELVLKPKESVREDPSPEPKIEGVVSPMFYDHDKIERRMHLIQLLA